MAMKQTCLTINNFPDTLFVNNMGDYVKEKQHQQRTNGEEAATLFYAWTTKGQPIQGDKTTKLYYK